MSLPGRVVALAVLLMAGCGAMDGPNRTPARQGVQFFPDQAGLAVVGTGQRVDFGRAPSGVIRVLDRDLAKHHALPLVGCPAGVVRQLAWGDLALTFTQERFVGWRNAAGSAGQVCG